MDKLDPRLNAYRDDLADITLQGRVKAQKFVTGIKRRVHAAITDIKKTPHLNGSTQSQLLMGSDVLVFDEHDGFSFIRSLVDGYAGYVMSADLNDDERPLTHRLKVARSFIYPMADLKTAPVVAISINSKLTITHFEEKNGTAYGIMTDGRAVIAHHLENIDVRALDFVCVAESLIHTPYLWGGTSGFGIDCSALVQISMAMAGRFVLRDSDMQQHSIGHELPEGLPLERGDLIFWRGHVAIVVDSNNLIHANGTSMDVCIEPVDVVIKRIATHYGRPICYRRAANL